MTDTTIIAAIALAAEMGADKILDGYRAQSPDPIPEQTEKLFREAFKLGYVSAVEDRMRVDSMISKFQDGIVQAAAEKTGIN